MFGPQLLIWSTQVGDLAQFQRGAQGVERCTPLLAVCQRATKDSQAVGLKIAVARALIGDVGGRGGTIEEQRLLTIVARLDLQKCAGKPEPTRGVIRRGCDELTEDQHACPEVIFLEGRVCIATQGRCGFVYRTRIALDLRLELDRRLFERALPEWFFGSGRGDQA